jgi:cytochrome c oxidase subunit 2
MFFYLVYRYRAKKGVAALYVTGKEKNLKQWINIPHILIILGDIVLIYFAVQVWYNVKQFTPEPPEGESVLEIDIIAQQWAWTFIHPGPDNILGNEDDIATIDELSVEANRLILFNLKSKDVMHDFSVPVLRLKQDAIPGRVIRGWFEATKTGDYDVQCAEMCGIGHGIMPAKIHIQSKDDHANWIKKQSKS